MESEKSDPLPPAATIDKKSDPLMFVLLAHKLWFRLRGYVDATGYVAMLLNITMSPWSIVHRTIVK